MQYLVLLVAVLCTVAQPFILSGPQKVLTANSDAQTQKVNCINDICEIETTVNSPTVKSDQDVDPAEQCVFLDQQGMPVSDAIFINVPKDKQLVHYVFGLQNCPVVGRYSYGMRYMNVLTEKEYFLSEQIVDGDKYAMAYSFAAIVAENYSESVVTVFIKPGNGRSYSARLIVTHED
ncbi:hypothetical protein MP228_012581 [Amoeboaphelidium protococcarum]|nr:hypothetical protein MP228_012581 [Amoeboaphelidium protococcarum]